MLKLLADLRKALLEGNIREIVFQTKKLALKYNQNEEYLYEEHPEVENVFQASFFDIFCIEVDVPAKIGLGTASFEMRPPQLLIKPNVWRDATEFVINQWIDGLEAYLT